MSFAKRPSLFFHKLELNFFYFFYLQKALTYFSFADARASEAVRGASGEVRQVGGRKQASRELTFFLTHSFPGNCMAVGGGTQLSGITLAWQVEKPSSI